MAEGTVEAAAKAFKERLARGLAATVTPLHGYSIDEVATAAVDLFTPLIRASVVAECAQAIKTHAAGVSFFRNEKPPEWHYDCDVAALVRALVSPLEGDKTWPADDGS